MSKRKKVTFAEDGELSDKAALKTSKRRKEETDADARDIFTGDDDLESSKKAEWESKHTLESDEEEEEKYDRLDMDNVEGQEVDPTVGDFEGDTKITPFNMKEEMGEGHFDSTGNFIFNKKGEELKDAWLDNIDWGRVKKDAGKNWEQLAQDNETDTPAKKIDRETVYSQLLELMQPKETVAKALKRLGGGDTSSAMRQRRWQQKKAKKSDGSGDTAEGVGEKSKVEELTELVDSLVAEGEMESFGYTFERIKHELESLRKKIPESDDDALDMFAAKLDKNESEGGESKKEPENPESSATGSNPVDENAVMWEFKWSQEEGAEIHGPSSSQQMLEWNEAGYFKDGVMCRKVSSNPNAPFYSSQRIDFDLYT